MDIEKLLAEVENALGSKPAGVEPADGRPTGSRAAGGTPARGTPARGTPARGTPARGTPARGTPAVQGGTDIQPAKSGVATRVSTAAVSGAVAAALIWVVFAALPFLGATSGAVGAFLATFVAILVLRRRG
jgi:hypothetical protein